MNFKPRILEALRLANHNFSVHFRRRKNGTLYPIWRPKLPPGSVTLHIEEDRYRSADVTATFHRRFQMGQYQTYPGLTLLTVVRVKYPRSKKHERHV